MIRGMKRGLFLQKSTLCLIMIKRKLDTVETLSHIKIKEKYAIGLEIKSKQKT